MDRGFAGQIGGKLSGMSLNYSRPDLKADLLSQKAELEHRLSVVNEAIGVLESNPDVGKLIDLLRKIGCA